MKKLLLFTYFSLFFTFIHAQITKPEHEQSIDSLLVDIDKTSFTSNILYDRVHHWAQLDEFNETKNISNKQHFEQALHELHLASNKEKFKSYELLRNQYTPEKIKNKVDIGIINASFHQINLKKGKNKKSGLKIVNNKFKKSRNDEPAFLAKDVLVIAPLKEYLRGKSITYNFDSKFLLQDTEKRKIKELTANFDTSKEHEIIKNGEFTSTNIKVNYTTDGVKTLTFTARFYDGSSKTTKSTVHVKTSPLTPGLERLVSDYPFEGISDYPFFYHGYGIDPAQIRGEIEYRIFYRLINGTPATNIRKPIIIIDGFDPLDLRKIIDEDSDLLAGDHRSIKDMMIYYDANGSEVNLIDLLTQKGYDVVVVNHPTYFIGIGWPMWPRVNGGADFIERNAMNHITLYQRLNNTLKQNGSQEELVIVGPSMGGQISRYALAYMEKKYADTGDELWNHNTRLWISVDSPHLGANIPMGVQSLLNTLYTEANSVGAGEFVNSWLGSAAARQQLIEQYGGRNGNDLLQDNLDAKTISQGFSQDKGSPFFIQYYNNLFNNGLPNSNGYPQNLRRIALVNGSMSGTKEFDNPYEYNRIALSGSTFNDVFTSNSEQVLKIEGTANVIGKIVQLESYFMPATGGRSKISYFKKKKPFGWNYYDRYITNINTRGNLDNSPGGWFPAQKDIAEEVNGSSSSDRIVYGLFDWSIAVNHWYIKNVKQVSSFIPTVSSLGFINPNFNWSQRLDNRNLVCSNEIPFDSYFGPKKNEQHTSFTEESVNWILKELGTNTEAPVSQDPVFPQYNLAPDSFIGTSVICNGATETYTTSSECSAANNILNWSISPNLKIISSTGSSITVKPLSTSTNGEAYIKAHFQSQSVQKDIWIGEPRVYVRLVNNPYLYNEAQFSLLGVGSDIMKQQITSIKWTKISGTTGTYLYATQNQYSGSARGPGNTWTINAKVEVTNSCGTIVKYFTLRPPPPGDDPCLNEITYSVKKSSINIYAIKKRVVVPCFKSSYSINLKTESEEVKSKTEMVVYNLFGQKVLKTNKKEIDLSNLKTGLYIIRASVNNTIITKKVFKE